MNVALYLRVSTDRQETENQAIQLRDFAKKQGWTIACEYTDDGVTGTTSERAELQRMFKDASQRKFDLVCFWALDRLSREGVLPTLKYLNLLESYGVGFRSFTEPWFDSCGIFKDAMLAIMATLAKQESVKRSERTKAGLARVKASGKKLGRPIKLNSWHRASVLSLLDKGLSRRAVARELHLSEHSVRRLAAA